MPTTAPTATPVQAPWSVGFLCLLTFTLPSASLVMTAASWVPITPREWSSFTASQSSHASASASQVARNRNTGDGGHLGSR